VFCQLETLQRCLPPSVRRTLDELPESLDMTYERVLKEIQKPNGDLTRRLLQCLVVAIQPLGVKELAEVLAVDFCDAEGIPKLKPNWRWEDQENAVLTSCSSLITIVETEDSRVVQFSHFSVKEYLTSERLATSSGGVSHYYIDLEPAHTILAQACMGVLLQPDDRFEAKDVGKRSPLTGYAAEHWVTHAQFESVSSFLRKAMEYIFDVDKPYFAAWLRSYDIDTRTKHSSLYWFTVYSKSGATPLYYAALCGFQDIVEHLVVKYPQDMNTRGGHYVTPLFAALSRRHFQTAEFLRHNGADVNVHGNDLDAKTPLLSAAWYGDLEVVRVLLDYKVDVNLRGIKNFTAIHYVSHGPHTDWTLPPQCGPQMLPDIARLLLEQVSDIDARADDGRTALHWAAKCGRVEVVHVLLEHGASVGAEDKDGETPFHLAAMSGSVDTVRVLLEHDANVAARDNEGRIPFHIAAEYGRFDVVRMLLEHGTNVDAEDKDGQTPFHRAARSGSADTVRVLLEHGANVAAKDNEGKIPFHLAAMSGSVDVVRMLLERGTNVDVEDNNGMTPFHIAAKYGRFDVVRMLLERGTNVDVEDNEGRTPLHLAASSENIKTPCLLLEHGANVGAKDNQGVTPLHVAADGWEVEVVRVLLEHGANVGAEDNEGRTAFQIASTKEDNDQNGDIMKLLSEHGAKGVL
jgi:ankyrin repeat protein